MKEKKKKRKRLLVYVIQTNFLLAGPLPRPLPLLMKPICVVGFFLPHRPHSPFIPCSHSLTHTLSLFSSHRHPIAL
ncbi:hypothetical protein F4778DRAFT_206547 [Xylariomycetidae sp. FL2044]|nr:hypothetical protein F4778DRAFT_206547 [Xylariomycetidae sp. FL2044]